MLENSLEFRNGRGLVHTFTERERRKLTFAVVGFGKSDKYTSPENYTHELHCLVLRKLLDHLALKEVSLVCQDWGGLTGLSVVKDTPETFASLVIMNTGLPAPGLDLWDNNEGDEQSSLTARIQGVGPFLKRRTVLNSRCILYFSHCLSCCGGFPSCCLVATCQSPN